MIEIEKPQFMSICTLANTIYIDMIDNANGQSLAFECNRHGTPQRLHAIDTASMRLMDSTKNCENVWILNWNLFAGKYWFGAIKQSKIQVVLFIKRFYQKRIQIFDDSA